MYVSRRASKVDLGGGLAYICMYIYIMRIYIYMYLGKSNMGFGGEASIYIYPLITGSALPSNHVTPSYPNPPLAMKPMLFLNDRMQLNLMPATL